MLKKEKERFASITAIGLLPKDIKGYFWAGGLWRAGDTLQKIIRSVHAGCAVILDDIWTKWLFRKNCDWEQPVVESFTFVERWTLNIEHWTVVETLRFTALRSSWHFTLHGLRSFNVSHLTLYGCALRSKNQETRLDPHDPQMIPIPLLEMCGNLFRPCREPQRVGQRAMKSEPISIGHGMALKIFWGIKEMPGADNDKPINRNCNCYQPWSWWVTGAE